MSITKCEVGVLLGLATPVEATLEGEEIIGATAKKNHNTSSNSS